jgi:hypothetical protein
MWNHQTVRVRDRLYSFGGFVDGNLSNEVYIVALRDDGSAHWSKMRQGKQTIPEAREGHSFVRYGQNVFLFGGTNGVDFFNDLFIFNPNANTWAAAKIEVTLNSSSFCAITTPLPPLPPILLFFSHSIFTSYFLLFEVLASLSILYLLLCCMVDQSHSLLISL